MRVRREHADDRLEAEIAEHLTQLAEEWERRGLTPEAARLEARRAFGGVQRAQDAHRDLRGWRGLADLQADVRYAIRTLRKTPVFAAVAVLTVALGIGANTAIFSIINSMFLRPLPVPAPEQLVEVGGVPSNLDVLQVLAASTDVFTALGTHEPTQFNLGTGGDADWVDGLWASAGLLQAARVQVAAGRGFTADDDRPGGGRDGPVALISDRFWQQRFGGQPAAVGQRLRINRLPVTIIGVTPPGFFGLHIGQSFDVVLPMGLRQQLFSEAVFGTDTGDLVGRLRDDLDIETARAALRGANVRIGAALATAGLIEGDGLDTPLSLTPLGSPDDPRRVNPYVRPLTVLMALVGFILLIACANLANLLMARAAARRQELAVRRALGATRVRLVRQLLAESAVLAAAGAAAGIVFALWASRFLVGLFGAEAAFSTGRIMFGPAQLSLDLTLDWRVLAFTGGVAMLTVCLFGTVPAVMGSGVMPMHALKDHGQNTPDRLPARYAGAVIVAQVAVSLVLLVGATLLIRTFASVSDVEFGFEPDRVLAIDAEPPHGRHPETALALYRDAMSVIGRVPGVEGVALSHGGVSGGFALVVTTAARSDTVSVRPVSPGWFAALGVPLLAGRDFTGRDGPGAAGVVIVNRAFVRRFLANANPLGQPVSAGEAGLGIGQPSATIVGVVDDIVLSAREGARSEVYVPMAQVDPHGEFLGIAMAEGGLTIVVRSVAGQPMALRRAVGDALAISHPDLALTFRSMRAELDGLLTRERVLALLSGFFGVLGLGLASVGLYGVTSYGIGRRRQEIGIRLALGAARRTVVAGVLGRSAFLVLAGITAGTVFGLWLSSFLVALLFGVEPQDPVTFAMAAATLLLVGLLAAAIPAWRASRVDPVRILRTD